MAMKLWRLALLLVMLLFMAVQYNDPDRGFWMVLYALPALLAAVALWRPVWLQAAPGRLLWALVVLTLLALLWHFWPREPGWWRAAVWWETESAREGMGVMIALVIALCTFVRRGSRDEQWLRSANGANDRH